VSDDTQAVEAQEAPAEGAAAAPAPAGENFTLRALVVGAVTFVVLLAMIVAIYVMKVGVAVQAAQTPVEEPATSNGADAAPVNVKILDRYATTIVMGPRGDSRRALVYTMVAVTDAAGAERLKRFLDADGDNMLPTVKERVRRIIRNADFLKLSNENLEDIKPLIVQELNVLLGDEIVTGIVFEDWDAH